MDLSKIYSKTSDWASTAAKKSKKLLHQARDAIDDSSPGPSSDTFSDSVRNALSHAANVATSHADQHHDSITLPPNISIPNTNLHIKFLKLLDEGGFSYVFEGIDLNSQKRVAVKRLLVQDDDMLKAVRHEIDIMRQLRDSEYIIKLLGVMEQREPGSKRVVYIVMEMASIGLIQLMQQRLEQRSSFSQQEVLAIFHDICRGVEVMHRQEPPLQHRDLKVENVLRVKKTYKLCDFGSATTRVYSLDTKRERSLAEEDINKHTTLAYRSPEMCDMYSDFPITEKSDIWALGCILYKLCYFNGPFEDAAAEGSFLPIINCKYVIPKEPRVETDILAFIREMLEINVNKRPDIWDVLARVAQLRGVENDVQRPGKGGKSGTTQQKSNTTQPSTSSSSTSRSRSNLTTPTSQSSIKRQDLFDLLGGPTSQEIAQQSSSVARRASPAPQQQRTTSAAQAQSKHPQSSSGFDDNDWDANFSDDDEFGEDPFKQQPASPQSPVVSITQVFDDDGSFGGSSPASKRTSSSLSVHQKTGGGTSLLDDLDWEDSTSTQNTTSGHGRSRSDNFASDLNFSGLTLHNRSPPPPSPLSNRSSTGSSHSSSTPQHLQASPRPRPKSSDALIPQHMPSSTNDVKRNNILAALDHASVQPMHHHMPPHHRGQHNRFHSFDVSMSYHQQQQQQMGGMMPQQPMYHTPQRPLHTTTYSGGPVPYGGNPQVAVGGPYMNMHSPQQPMRTPYQQQQVPLPQMVNHAGLHHQHMRQSSTLSNASFGSNGGSQTPTSPSSNPFDALFE